jgi:hypothetical protein
MKTIALALTVSACMVDAPPEETVATHELEIGGSHPCLTEAADLTFSPGATIDGVAIPQSYSYTQGNCKSLIAEGTQVGAGHIAPTLPLIYTYVAFPEALATSELECLRMSSFERAYQKINNAANWTFVGEVHRFGVWNNGVCSQLHSTVGASVKFPAAIGATRKLRIVASGHYSASLVLPVIWYDHEPLVPEQR